MPADIMPTDIIECGSTAAEDAEPIAPAAPDLSACELFVSRLALPVFGNRLCEPPSLDMRRAVDLANASVLDFLLHDADLEAMARSTDERLVTALAPLRTKLDMLIDMVARLSYRAMALPPVCDVELRPGHIVWQSRQLWQRGDWLRLELFFHPVFREPVSLLTEVAECGDERHRGTSRIAGELAPMPPDTVESLARLAFLTQRQQQSRHRARISIASET